MQGTGKGFEPESKMTRAMLVTVLYRMANTQEKVRGTSFSDVPSGQWYSDAILWAEENNIVSGVSEDKFAPDEDVTREQMALIIYRYAKMQGIDVTDASNLEPLPMQIMSVIELGAAFYCFFPGGEFGIESIQTPKTDRKLTKRTLVAALLILLAIPLTIYIGVFFLGDRKYYFISLLIILETMIPFCMVFESRKPQARELVVISVLCAIAVAGRAAFFMLPQFKPVVALVIIAGVSFGGETGFLVGAVTGFVSNFFFGQGPWTPWQMFAFGIIGFIAGIFFKKGYLRKTKASLCIFGFIATLVIYGGIMNPASVIMW